MVTKKDILVQLKELTDLIKSEQFEKYRADSNELTQVRELLSHIRFKIKDIRLVDNEESLDKTIQITYELPRVKLTIDPEGNISKNDFFYATNFLEMISMEDMQKLQDFIESAKK